MDYSLLEAATCAGCRRMSCLNNDGKRGICRIEKTLGTCMFCMIVITGMMNIGNGVRTVQE